MTWRRLTAPLWLVAALAAGAVLCPLPGQALQTGFQAGANSDTLTISAESGTLPKYSVQRTGPQELTVLIQPAPGEKAAAAPRVGGSKLVSSVRAIPGGFKIQLRTSGFGYVHSAPSGRLQIQVFDDPIGARWSAGPAKPEAKPSPKTEAKVQPAVEKKAPPATDNKPGTAPEKTPETAKKSAKEIKAEKLAEKKRQQEAKVDEAARKKADAETRRVQEAAAKHAKEAVAKQAKAPVSPPAPMPAPAPIPAPAPEASIPAQPAQVAPAKTDTATGQPYFSVPYSMRAPVNKTVLGLPSGSTTTLPQVAGQPVAPQAPGKQPQAKAVGGKLPTGVQEKPILQDQLTPQQNASQPPRQPEAALPAPVRSEPVDVHPEKGKDDVRFRADHRSPEESRLAEIVSGTAAVHKAAASAPASTGPASTGPAQAQGARPWELRQQVQKPLPPSEGASNATLPPIAQAPVAEHSPAPPEANASQHSPAPAPAKATANATANASANASDHGQPKEDAKDAHAAPGKAGGKDKP
ncbi:MAG: hypothetical protein Q7I92_09270, partial [Humidesulfovibrio sp.]|nr:hypothetical protein [Humidesulfovibrio sp.]